MKHTTQLATLAFTLTLLAVPSVAAGEYNLHKGTQTQGYDWGDGVFDLGPENQLTVTLAKNGDYVDFKLESGLIDGDGAPTIALDNDVDGTADYQIQRHDGEFQIAYPNGDSFGEFQELPSKFSTSYETGKAVISVPISELDADDRFFKFGAMVLPDTGQVNYPETKRLWYNGDNYVSSDHYGFTLIDHQEEDTTVPNTNTQRSDSSIVQAVMNYFKETTHNIVKDWVRDNFVSQEQYNDLTETVVEQNRRIKQLENETGTVTDVDDLEVAQDVMMKNDIDEMTVEHDGEEWNCDRRIRERDNREQVVCSTGH